MKKLMICALAATASICCQAQAVVSLDDGKYTITSGDIVMTVDALQGGKVASFALKGQEALAQHQKIEGLPWENPNDWGSTFWPAPQSVWNWPPIATYDSLPYTATVEGDTLTLTSAADAKYPYIFTKRFSPGPMGGIVVDYRIANAGESAVAVAPWEITRVASGGVIMFKADKVWPEDVVAYERDDDGVVRITFVPLDTDNRKIFADGDGFLAHFNNGLAFLKFFPNIAQSDAAPGEAEIEVYYNRGTTYTEIESQGAYTTLEPGQTLSYPVLWFLAPQR